jgi:peptidase inhibitor family I36
MKTMMTRARVRAVAVCALATVLVGAVGSGPAMAEESGKFAEQARSAGLSSVQATELQKAVNKHLAANPGSVQTAANRIDFAGGSVLLALPGEKTARDLPSTDKVSAVAAAAAAAGTCAYNYACFWSGENYTGSVYRLFYCNTWQTIPWYTKGSWKNNQSTGTKIGIDPINSGPYYAFPAYSAVTPVYWENIYRVSAC